MVRWIPPSTLCRVFINKKGNTLKATPMKKLRELLLSALLVGTLNLPIETSG
ncbi:MAG: hypothetical protein M2R45_01568 [Verrucomicrobia subdivision 3 bacterium]|nr:hypothetical protein [Limisphaerales bacterium]MCS1413305.1 hypothetical protein [Limisphaerales bacterium]